MAAKLFRRPASTGFSAEQALNDALKDDLSDVLIIGYEQDGSVYSIEQDDLRRGSVHGQ